MLNFLDTELLTIGYFTIRLINIPFLLIGIIILYIFFNWLFRYQSEKIKTIDDARDMVTKYLGSKFMLFPPGNNNPKYTITYNNGGDGDVNIAIARGSSFKAVFEIARDWVSNNYVFQQLGQGYFVLLPDAGNDFKHIILKRPRGANSGEIIATGISLQNAVENAFLVLKADPGND